MIHRRQRLGAMDTGFPAVYGDCVALPGDDSLPLFAAMKRSRTAAEASAQPADKPVPAAADKPAPRAADNPAPVAADKPVPRPGSRELPLTVAQMMRAAGAALDHHVGTAWVEGEVGSLTRPASGHIYFSLAGDRALVRAVMWRSDAARLSFKMTEGIRIRCRGRLGIYASSGKFQLYVQTAEPAGAGQSALALEQLRQRLAAEGLFDPAKKRPLPHIPRRLGVVTSRTGAAVRDVIRAVFRRFPVPIVIADARVQGADAPRQIAAAIAAVCRAGADCVIVGRGGGSAGDLSAFNDERVVRAVAACPVPTISAVGHEIDISLTDLAADHRAATPTMAGEMAVPVKEDLERALSEEQQRLAREIGLYLRDARQQLDSLADHAHHAVSLATARRRHALADCGRTLAAHHPRAHLVANRRRLDGLSASLGAGVARALATRQRELSRAAGRLDAMSPLAVLGRGYALATADGHVLTDAAQVAAGDAIVVGLARGRLGCRVETTDPGGEPTPGGGLRDQ